jgi:hypothetical protein
MHQTDSIAAHPWLRAGAVLGIVTLGLLGIVGSGGGALGLPSDCPPGYNCNAPATPVPELQPEYVTAQVGTPVTFAAPTTNVPAAGLSYHWFRSSDGGAHFIAVPGATSDTLALSSVNLADDGAIFRVTASANGVSGSALGHLTVSPGPGVVFADGEFPASGWTASPLANGTTPAPTHAEEALASGGHPGGYRKMVVQMAPQVLTAVVGHASIASTYAPQVQGEILVIDYAEDGISLETSSRKTTSSALLLEQGGRRYGATARGFYISGPNIPNFGLNRRTPSACARPTSPCPTVPFAKRARPAPTFPARGCPCGSVTGASRPARPALP